MQILDHTWYIPIPDPSARTFSQEGMSAAFWQHTRESPVSSSYHTSQSDQSLVLHWSLCKLLMNRSLNSLSHLSFYSSQFRFSRWTARTTCTWFAQNLLLPHICHGSKECLARITDYIVQRGPPLENSWGPLLSAIKHRTCSMLRTLIGIWFVIEVLPHIDKVIITNAQNSQ